MKVNLILEGGGMRGIYTSGVLDYFMEQGLMFLDVVGVSAGALNAISYKSWQPYRTKKTYLEYSSDKRYISLTSLVKTKNIFGIDFIFHTIPDELLPLDYEAFNQSPIRLKVVLTNLETGKAEYKLIEKLKNDLNYLIATSSLPYVSKSVEIDGKLYLDGGVADSLPLMQSMEDGFDLHVLVLTRHHGYVKPDQSNMRYAIGYRKYPLFRKALEDRTGGYNKTLDKIRKLEKEKKIFVIAPRDEITISRFETDPIELHGLYNQGYEDAKNCFDSLQEYIKDAKNVKKKSIDD